MGNHLSLRPEPGADNAVERRLALYLVLLREEFTSTAALSLPARWALTPPFQPYRKNSGGIFSVALVFPRLIVRGILLFKRTPCSMQSGLSSAGKRTDALFMAHPDILPAAIARGHMFHHLIYIRQTEYASILPSFFIKSLRYSTKMQK